jgi:hypothetical protein
MKRLGIKKSNVQLIHTAHAVQPTLSLVMISTYAQLVLKNRFSVRMATLLTRSHPNMEDRICARSALLEPTQFQILLAAHPAHPAIFATAVPTLTHLFQSHTTVVRFALRVLTVPKDLTLKNFALPEPTTRMLALALLKSVLFAPPVPQTICTELKAVPLVANSPQVTKVLSNALALERTEFTHLSITRADVDQDTISRTLTVSVRDNLPMLLTVFHSCLTVATQQVKLEIQLEDARRRMIAKKSVKV